MPANSKTDKKLPTPSKRREFLPLELETRSTVETSTAAYHLNRKEQTLRYWACYDCGPIHPIRINGRLHWRVADIRYLIEGASHELCCS